jgi:hypothetical protein
MSEPDSDKTWAEHNGCTGALSSEEGIAATYVDHQTHQTVKTTATKWTWGGCPPTAPVEYYQVIGAPHGGASTIDNKEPFWIVFDFWGRVEQAHTMAHTQEEVERGMLGPVPDGNAQPN